MIWLEDRTRQTERNLKIFAWLVAIVIAVVVARIAGCLLEV